MATPHTTDARARSSLPEAINRAIQVAQTEGSATVELEHLERILPQLLLDF